MKPQLVSAVHIHFIFVLIVIYIMLFHKWETHFVYKRVSDSLFDNSATARYKRVIYIYMCNKYKWTPTHAWFLFVPTAGASSFWCIPTKRIFPRVNTSIHIVWLNIQRFPNVSWRRERKHLCVYRVRVQIIYNTCQPDCLFRNPQF